MESSTEKHLIRHVSHVVPVVRTERPIPLRTKRPMSPGHRQRRPTTWRCSSSKSRAIDSKAIALVLFCMKVETLGDAFTLSWRITARCTGGVADDRTHTRPCIYREELDLHTLVWTRGRNFPPARPGGPAHVSAMWRTTRFTGLSAACRAAASERSEARIGFQNPESHWRKKKTGGLSTARHFT
jgi:hypothetical protein